MKPAVKTMPPRGGSTAKTTNQKTIGINKLGTLLSSQTTDTPSTTTTKHTVADRSGATFQTYSIPHPNTNPCSRISISMKTAPPTRLATKRTIFQAVQKGVSPLSFRISGGDSENNTRPPTPPQIRDQGLRTLPETANFRGFRRCVPCPFSTFGGLELMSGGSHPGRSQPWTRKRTSNSASRGFSR